MTKKEAYKQGKKDALKPISNLIFHYLIDDEARAVIILDAIRDYVAGQIKEWNNE